MVVLAHPAFEEVSNATKLLQHLKQGGEAEAVLATSTKVLEAAKSVQYLQSAIAFPDGSGEPPFPRFVIKK
jgi:hypothetical protein